MAAIVVTHDEQGSSQVVDTDGHEFAFLMADRTILGQSLTDIVTALVTGYEQVVDEPRQADWARFMAAANLADVLAETLLAAAVNDGTVAIADVLEDELNVLMPQNRVTAEPFTGEWGLDVPLVLVRTDYVPFTARELPTGNVVFVDPANEATFVDSLVEAGIGQLMTKETEMAEAADL